MVEDITKGIKNFISFEDDISRCKTCSHYKAADDISWEAGSGKCNLIEDSHFFTRDNCGCKFHNWDGEF